MDLDELGILFKETAIKTTKESVTSATKQHEQNRQQWQQLQNETVLNRANYPNEYGLIGCFFAFLFIFAIIFFFYWRKYVKNPIFQPQLQPQSQSSQHQPILQLQISSSPQENSFKKSI